MCPIEPPYIAVGFHLASILNYAGSAVIAVTGRDTRNAGGHYQDFRECG
jgi:hypothetical protein